MVSEILTTAADYLYRIDSDSVKSVIDYARSIPPEYIKKAADYVSAGVSALFSVSLIPQLIQGRKGTRHIHPHTSFMNATGCYVLAANFGLLLGLHYSGLTNLAIGTMWTMAYKQAKRYERKNKLEDICAKEVESLPKE